MQVGLTVRFSLEGGRLYDKDVIMIEKMDAVLLRKLLLESGGRSDGTLVLARQYFSAICRSAITRDPNSRHPSEGVPKLWRM